MTTQRTERFTVTIEGEALETLMRVAKQRGKSPNEALSDAIALLEWAAGAKQTGQRVLLEKKGKV